MIRLPMVNTPCLKQQGHARSHCSPKPRLTPSMLQLSGVEDGSDQLVGHAIPVTPRGATTLVKTDASI